MTLLSKYSNEGRALIGSIMAFTFPAIHQLETWFRFYGTIAGAILVTISIVKEIRTHIKRKK